METTTARRRAPGMSPERRRQMIVAVALPLVAEYGAAVTTAQIARAAGIGEATIFRAFTDKDELLDACMAEALRPDQVLEQLAAIPLDQPLTGRLVEAADAMRAHMARIGTVIAALHASGRRPRDRPGVRLPPRGPEAASRAPAGAPSPPEREAGTPAPGRGEGDPSPEREDAARLDRESSFRETRRALAELFEPERDSLRLPPERLAALFLAMVFAGARQPEGVPELSADLVDVFVHGALT
ncbi:TetR family transcriptional regulator [Streptosporangium sp. NPDC005286]|uniref:TetR/AcrR family transcriptional regulator n=1 Tax=Streptosporangium sp. NPDC005286 TaxID=3154463 RepID=UPI0033A3760C